MFELRYKKLKVWDKTIHFIQDVYKLTGQFPDADNNSLAPQIRRASVSVAMNIAEGSVVSQMEFGRFLTQALKSSNEAMFCLEIAQELKFMDPREGEALIKQCNELSAMIGGLRKKVQNPTAKPEYPRKLTTAGA